MAQGLALLQPFKPYSLEGEGNRLQFAVYISLGLGRMDANPLSNNPELVSIGDFSPRDADRLLAALTQAGVEFQIDCDDGIYSYPPSHATNWGAAARVRVFVAPGSSEHAQKLSAKLFGDFHRET